MKPIKAAADLQTVRLDRWLWAARFFKTRAVAKQAIEGGKIHFNGQRCKPSRAMHCGETLSIRKGYDLFTVLIIGLAEKRGPAKTAQKLYEETEESLSIRKKAADIRKLQPEFAASQRPDKRQRRKIHQFKQSQS